MFRIVKSNNVFATSAPRKSAMQDLSDISREVVKHLLKCIIYENSTQDYNHRIHGEIAGYLDHANQYTIKPKGKKLSKQDYLDSLFSPIGDSKKDAQLRLEHFYFTQVKTHRYPDFEISNGLIEATFYLLEKYSSIFSDKFSRPNTMSKQDIESELRDILDEAIHIKHR